MRSNIRWPQKQPSNLQSSRFTCLPVVLLYSLSVAAILCMAVMVAFYGYWLVENASSQYRRQMNASAYNAQIFFDQREQLLHSTVASSIRNLKGVGKSSISDLFGVNKQVDIFPLVRASNEYEWALVMTPRNVDAFHQMQVELIYTSGLSGATRHVLNGRGESNLHLTEETQRWIYEMLQRKSRPQATAASDSVIWLTPPTSGKQSLLMYIPVDAAIPGSGWVGLAVPDIAGQLGLFDMHGVSSALYAPSGKPLVEGASGPPSAHVARAQRSYFGGDEWQSYFEYFELSKSVGEAGWRLRYFMPREQVLKEVLPKWGCALLVGAFLVIGVIVGSRYIHRRILEPAQSQVRKLAESFALNKALLSASPVGLALVRRHDGASLLSNDLAQAWLSPEVLLGLQEVGEAALMKEQVLLDGRVVQTTFTPLKYGNERAVLCTLNDITTLKKAEQTLQNGKREAERISQAKTVFFTTLSHEIRTPLYGVIGALDLLALTTTTLQQRQYLEAVHHSSKALLSTINNTLDLARIEAGHQTLEVKSFSPLEVVEEVIAAFAMRAESKQLMLYAAIDAQTPARVIGASQALRQILDNFVNNAIKFTEAGRITVRLHTVVEQGKAMLRFQVADTGMGIASEELQHLFEPYYRGGNEGGFQGSGLGLSICAKLAEQMNAALKVRSQQGSGTCVELAVSLPLDTNAVAYDSPVLQALPVYVRGAAPEVVALTCDWLCSWGAKAEPYRPHQRVEATAVVLETWPWATPMADVPARKVIAQPLTEVVAPTSNPLSAMHVSAYSLLAMGRAVRQAQDGSAVEPEVPRSDGQALNARILVVEDHPVTRMVLTEQLTQLGCNIEIAENGQQALRSENIMEFDAIVTDINMPYLGGLGLAEILRLKGYQRPIIGLTASILSGDQEKYFKAGISVLLGKPLSMLQMLKTLKRLGVS